MKELPVGGTLVLECTDPLTAVDIPFFARQTGHELARYEQRGDLHVFSLIKREKDTP